MGNCWCPVCVQVSIGGGGGGGKLSLHLNDGWYDAVHGLGDDEEAVHVVLSGHVGSHKGEDGHDVV